MKVNNVSDLTEITKLRMLTQYQVVAGLPANRPELLVVPIAVTNVNDVVLGDLFVECQLLSIVAFAAAPARTRYRTTALAAKIASIAGGSLDELNYIDEAVLQAPGFSQTGLIYSIIESEDIVITLNGGHGIETVHFYVLPSTYLVAPENINNLNWLNS